MGLDERVGQDVVNVLAVIGTLTTLLAGLMMHPGHDVHERDDARRAQRIAQRDVKRTRGVYRMQQGHQQVLVGQHNGGLYVTHTVSIFPHRLHQLECLLGLSHIRRDRDHRHIGALAVKGLQRFCPKPLAVAIDEQRPGVVGSLFELYLHAGVIPPEIGLASLVKAVEKFGLGYR